MLKNVKLYEDRLIRLGYEYQYDLTKNLACGDTGGANNSFSNDNDNSHNFVSVNKEDEILGIIGYEIDWEARKVSSIYIISYSDRPCPLLIRDLLHVVHDIFLKYNLHKIEWRAYADNPVVPRYRKFCERYGGTEVGTLHESVLLMDGKVHDVIIFELMRENYLKRIWKK
jgi:hypothetical protein